MIVIPAIDLLDGEVVRLEQGDYKRKKVYSKDPVETAKIWRKAGARLIHVVDLNGARRGRPANLDRVKKIIHEIPDIEIEFGGGIRDMGALERIVKAGVSKVILGTAAIKDRDFSVKCLSKYGRKMIFSIDAREESALVEGWGRESGAAIKDLIRDFEALGLKRIIYTDVLKDGMMKGPNLEGIGKVLAMTGLEVIASGGVSSIGDIKALKALEKKGLKGVIIGRALYEGKIDLGEAIRAAA